MPLPPSVMVAVPCVDWMWTPSANALLSLGRHLPLGSWVELLQEGTTIARKRNDAVRRLLGSSAEYLYFSDSDMQPPQDTVSRLLQHGRDVVSALYFGRRPPYWTEFAPYGTNAQDPDAFDRPIGPGLVRARWCGAGALLIHRRVFEGMNAPWFEAMEADEGEDWDFCERLLHRGVEIYVDTDLCVPHVGAAAIDRERALSWRASHRGQIEAYLRNNAPPADFDSEVLDRYKSLRNANRDFVNDTRAFEESDPAEAIRRYREALIRLREYESLKRERGAAAERGDPAILYRLALCLTAAGRREEVQAEVDAYVRDFPEAPGAGVWKYILDLAGRTPLGART